MDRAVLIYFGYLDRVLNDGFQFPTGKRHVQYQFELKVSTRFSSRASPWTWSRAKLALASLAGHYRSSVRDRGRHPIQAVARASNNNLVSFEMVKVDFSLVDFRASTSIASGEWFPTEKLPAGDCNAVIQQGVAWASSFTPGLIVPENTKVNFASGVVQLRIDFDSAQRPGQRLRAFAYSEIAQVLSTIPRQMRGVTAEHWAPFLLQLEMAGDPEHRPGPFMRLAEGYLFPNPPRLSSMNLNQTVSTS